MNSSYQGLISSAADNTFQMEVLAVASGGNKELMHCWGNPRIAHCVVHELFLCLDL